MGSHTFLQYYAEWHHAECRFAKCHGAQEKGCPARAKMTLPLCAKGQLQQTVQL
jgi:hypothetical protein